MSKFKIINVPVYKTALEEVIARGIMDERDIDFLSHLKFPGAPEVAMEGIIKATLADPFHVIHEGVAEVKGWTQGIESKRKYIEEICEDLVIWLKDEQAENPKLDLDMGSFKTWMKTSELYQWRYYFLLHDTTWNKIESDLKSGKISALETLYSIDFSDRKEVTDHMDSVRNIQGLIKIVELYILRSNKFFELIVKREISIKMFPFQVILLGAADLRRTVKKIVNLSGII